MSSVSAPESVDVAIVTALQVERDAILSRLDGPATKVQEPGAAVTYYRGRIATSTGGQDYSVVVLMLHGPGNEEAAIATTRVLQRWHPRAVLIVGIAGGVRGTVALGDVVVGDFVHYYELAKITPSGTQTRPQQFRSSRLLYDRALAYDHADWRGLINTPRPSNLEGPHDLPKAHFGGIAAGDKVIADAEALAELLRQQPKVVAVAMEGAGTARAVQSNARPPDFLEIRGISDFADATKSDGWHNYAASAAAAFAVGLLRSQPLAPADTARPPVGKGALKVLRAQSLRLIAPDEVLTALPPDLAASGIEPISLDFTDLVQGDVVSSPEDAVRRLTDPTQALARLRMSSTPGPLAFHGLVHIPIASLIGAMVTDRTSVRMFDFHPTVGTGTWTWPERDEAPFPPIESRGLPQQRSDASGDVVVRMAVSYEVDATPTRVVVPDAEYDVSLRVSTPERGVVRSEEQTRAYGRAFRGVLDALAQRLPKCTRIHLFYAGPVSLAFHLGQQVSGNIHPPVTVWNFRRGAYEWGIDLAAACTGTAGIARPAPESRS